MSDKLAIFVNDEPVFEYDRKIELDDQQLAFLDKMDNDMSQGFKIQGEMIVDSAPGQRAEFVAMNLIKALRQDNEASVMVCCAYLTQRNSELREVRVSDADKGVVVNFVGL